MKKRTLALILAVMTVFTGLPGDALTQMASAKTKLKLNKTKLTLTAGQKKTLKVKGTKKKVTWSSSKKKVASVSQKGVVTAKKAGQAKIKAKVGKKTLTCKVTVKAKKNATVSIPTPTSAPDSSAVPEISFSKDSGTYDQEFNLTLSNSFGKEIYYTTDGSDPRTSLTRQKYSGAISIKSRKNDANVLAAISPTLLESRCSVPNKKQKTLVSRIKAPADSAVDKCTVIKVVGSDGKGGYGEVATNTYFIGKMSEHIDGIAASVKASGENLSVISISMDYNDLFDHEKGIYVRGKCFEDSLKALLDQGISINDVQNDNNVPLLTYNYKQRGKAWEREAHIEYFETNGTQTERKLSDDCGIRIQGNYSRETLQKSFRLFAKEKYGVKNFKYPFFSGLKDAKGETLDKFKTLVLRNGGNDSYNYKYKDLIMQKLSEGIDCWTLTGRPCVVYLNGEYWGDYILQDDPSDNLLQQQYGVKKEDVLIYKGTDDPRMTDLGDRTYAEYGYKLDEGKLPEGEAEDYYLRDALEYIQNENNDFSKDSVYREFFNKYFDESSTIDYLASNYYLNNGYDWPGKNWMIWKTLNVDSSVEKADGKWRFICNDLDLTTATTWLDNVGDTWKEKPTDQAWIRPMIDRQSGNVIGQVWAACLENASFRTKMQDRMRELAKTNFKYEIVEKVGNQFYQTYSLLYMQFLNRFAPMDANGNRAVGDCMPDASHQANMDFMRLREGYIDTLCKFIQDWPENQDSSADYDTPEYNPTAGFVWEGKWTRWATDNYTASATKGLNVTRDDNSFLQFNISDWSSLTNPVLKITVADGYAENARTHIWGDETNIGYFYQNEAPWIGKEFDISALKGGTVFVNANDATILKVEIYNKPS